MNYVMTRYVIRSFNIPYVQDHHQGKSDCYSMCHPKFRFLLYPRPPISHNSYHNATNCQDIAKPKQDIVSKKQFI